jgi:hypothetical protein
VAKTTEITSQPSLLDTADYMVREWYVVFHHRTPFFWWAKYLKPGFLHVELTRPVRFGPGVDDVVWLNLLPGFEMLDAEISTDPRPPWLKCPTSTTLKITTMAPHRKMRSWFDLGPITCVEIVKVALGIRAFWVRTPWQLFQYLKRRNGVVSSE